MAAVRMHTVAGNECPIDCSKFHIDPLGAWQPCDWQSLGHLHIPNSIRVLYRKQCSAMDQLIGQSEKSTQAQHCAFLRREVALQYAWRLTRDLLGHQHDRADLSAGSADSVSLDQLLERVARRAIDELQACDDYSDWSGSAIFDDCIIAVRNRLPEYGGMLDSLLTRQVSAVVGR